MARSRVLHPGFFTNHELFAAEARLRTALGEPGASLRLAFAGLWGQADKEGRFEWNPARLKLGALPFDDGDFGTILEALADAQFIVRYEVDGKQYGHIPTWHSHQRPHPREAESKIPGPPKKTKASLGQAKDSLLQDEAMQSPSVYGLSSLRTIKPSEGTAAQGEPCPVELTNELHRAAYEHFYARARNKQAFAAEVRANALGMPGHTSGKPYGWPTMGRALHDLMVDGGDCTALRLRIFADKVRDLPEFQEDTEEVCDDTGRAVKCRAVDGWWVSVESGERIAEVAALILHGDCLDVMPTLGAESVDSIVTDPPYALTSGKKGGSGEASLNLDSPAGRARITTGGFMGKAWDAAIPGPEIWAEALRVAKPGAHLLAFGGTRTYHRLTCAIEDAGWEIRDCLSFLYGRWLSEKHEP